MRLYDSRAYTQKQHNVRLVSTQEGKIWNRPSLSELNRYKNEGIQSSIDKDIATLLAKYDTLLDTFYSYPFLSGSIMQIARTISGSNYGVVPRDFSVKMNPELQNTTRSILNFFTNAFLKRRWNNIKDAVTPTAKIKLTVINLILFGQAGWEVIRDGRGAAIGFDFIHGVVIPNTEKNGTFKNPAYKVYPLGRANLGNPVEFDSPQDVVLFTDPAVTGEMIGRNYLESLLEYTIPADIYAAKSYLYMHKNYKSPAGIWTINDADDEEDWESISAYINSQYKGVNNYNSSAIVTNKQVDFKEFRAKSKDDAPYLEGRNFAKGEMAAVTGVPTAKLGISEDMDKSDLQVMKREFYESTLRPLVRLLEETIDEQVIGRYFYNKELVFQFDQPDFLTQLERATVARRLYESNSLNPNEVRAMFNKPPRDKDGELFRDEALIQSIEARAAATAETKKVERDGIDSEVGGPPSDRLPGVEPQEREPGDIGVSVASEAPRSERQRISLRSFTAMMNEIQQWERFMLDVALGNRAERQFMFKQLPPLLAEGIYSEVELLIFENPNQAERVQWVVALGATLRELIVEFYDVIESLED